MTTSFDLTPRDIGSILEGPASTRLRLELCGRGLTVSEGDKVVRGQPLARAEREGGGRLHSPLDGVVEKVGGDTVVLKSEPREGPRKKPDIEVPDEPLARLRAFGVDSFGLCPARTLVVNGLEPEPGVKTHAAILMHRRDELLAGLDLLREAVRPARVVLALPRGVDTVFDAQSAGFEVHLVDPVYPAGLMPLVVRSVTGRENPSEVAAISVSRLLEAGRVAQGEPVTTTVLTAGGKVFEVRIGTPLADILDAAGLRVAGADVVAEGGVMRGAAQYDLSRGVDKGVQALTVVPSARVAHCEDAPCVNCGECVRRCPARIMVGLMTRHAEFGYHEKALEYDLDSCIECGLCGYYCPMRRPLLQYIRLAKSELSLQGLYPGSAASASSGTEGEAA